MSNKSNDLIKSNAEQVNPTVRRLYHDKNIGDIINIPRSFKSELFSLDDKNRNQILKGSVLAMRILFKLFNDISFDQFQPKRQEIQLNLFENTFLTENNIYASFSYKVTDIDKNRNYLELEKALNYLELLHRQWYKITNSKGEKIKVLGGVISLPEIKKGRINFLVSSYMMEKMLNIDAYNRSLLRTAWDLSNTKQILFYLWLLGIESNTKIGLDKINNSFNLNYKTAGSACKNFLKPIKIILDEKAHKSFNFNYKGSTVYIKVYLTSEETKKVNSSAKFTLLKNRKIKYWRERHKLTLDQKNTLNNILYQDPSSLKIMITAYSSLIRYFRSNKVAATEFQQDEFLRLWQEKIIEEYNGSPQSKLSAKGYPIVLENNHTQPVN